MLLEVQNVSKKYVRNGGEFFALDNVSFTVDKGEFIAVCGHSGSGKSTLFNLIAGLAKPDKGRIVFDSVCISYNNDYDMAKYRNREIGYIIQGQSVLSGFTVLENICLPFHLSENKSDIYDKAMKLLKEVGLDQYADAYPSQLSGGEMRRVAIARALINDPKLIIADEPTSNLDCENAIAVMKLLKKISDSGIGVIISTHDSLYNGYADRLMTMDHGSLAEIHNYERNI